MIVFFWNIKSGIYVYSEIYFMDCTKSFWLMVCTTKKTFSKVGQVKKRVFTRFLTALMAFTPFFLPSLPINRLISLQFLTSSSFSSSPLLHFYNDVFPSLAFHRKGLFGNPSGVLWSVNSERVSLGVRLVCLGVSLTIMVSCSLEGLVPPLSPHQQWSYWYVISAGAIGIAYPPRNSFRFLCKKLKKLQHYCNVLFKYQ